ncbi:hypothetical protein [Streptomyces sp. 5.8]|uniref:hypothetical protein n=1 Tax=Streptomyces sp. 5.8 TaxID=3406571 RepID=UPI003BB4B7A0
MHQQPDGSWPPPSPSPPSAGDRPTSRRIRPAIAAVAAAALLAGGGTTAWVLADSADHPSKTSSPPGAKANSEASTSSGTVKIPRGPFAPRNLAEAWKTPVVTGDILRTKLMGTWRTSKAYYVGRGSGLEVLDLATGQSLGQIAPPEPGMTPCGMSDTLNQDGFGAVAWLRGDPESPRASCDQISLVDTRKGNAIVWTTTVSGVPLRGKPLTNDTVRLGWMGDVLAVMSPNTIVGLKPDKSTAWSWQNPGAQAGAYVLNWDMTVARDRIMVMLGTEQGADWTYEVATLDNVGRQLSAAVPLPAPKDGAVDLVSAAPMTALVRPDHFDHQTAPELVVFNQDGGIARRIKLATPVGPARAGQLNLLGRSERYNIQFAAGRAYVTSGDPLDLNTPTHITAFDMASGTALWSRPVDTVTQPRFIGADDDRVYVLGGKAAKDMALYAYAAADGTRTQISTVKQPNSLLMLQSRIIDYTPGNLAMVDTGRDTAGVFMFRAPST